MLKRNKKFTLVKRSRSKNVVKISFFDKKGNLHRFGGPAKITFNRKTMQVIREEWYRHGVMHRVGGPALTIKTRFHDKKMWLYKGAVHNRTGPSVISKISRGIDYIWCIMGVVYSKEEWFETLTKEERINYIFNMEY